MLVAIGLFWLVGETDRNPLDRKGRFPISGITTHWVGCSQRKDSVRLESLPIVWWARPCRLTRVLVLSRRTSTIAACMFCCILKSLQQSFSKNSDEKNMELQSHQLHGKIASCL